MDRRRSLLKIAALRSEREQQVGVNCTKGYLQLQSAGLLFEGPRTLECLFRYIPSDKMQVIAGFGISMIEIYALTTNQLRVYCGGGNATVDIIPGDSYLVDVAYDGTTAICYLNGTEAARFPVTGYKITDLFRTGSNTYIPQGSLVFCRHYNYALSAEEVAALYNDGDPSGYVLPIPYKYKVANYISDFSKNTDGWSTVANYPGTSLNSGDGILSIYGDSTTLAIQKQDLSSGDKPSIFRIRIVFVEPFQGSRIRFFAHSFNDYADLTLSSEKLNAEGVVHIKKASNTVPNSFMYSYDVPIGDVVKISTITIESVGCVAEYLPQNLVGQWHEKPFEITGITTYTWTGETDPVYYQELLLGRFIQTGAVVMIKGSVSDYQSGEPFVYVGNRQAMIPAQNGSFTLKVINNRDNIDRIYYYGGTVRSDRRLTITIDSVELIPDVALSWLDSAKQFPLNDEYLPPLLQSDGGYDLAANGTPQIIIK